jgi:hypothetical protein
VTSEELAEVILSGPRFQSHLTAITLTLILQDLPAISPTEAPAKIDWNHALFCCSALTTASSEKAQEAALRVAQGCLSVETSEPAHHNAAAVLLERLGNRPAVELAERRELVEVDAWDKAPSPLQLDVIHSRLALTISVADGESIAANRFQREFWNRASSYLWLSVSAPTSAGKSYVVKRWFGERLAATEGFRGVYLVPTRALIEEVTNDLRAHFPQEVGVYALPWDGDIGTKEKEIHVLTQERLHLLQQRFADFAPDLLFVDEAQKFGDDSRGVLLQRVLDEAVRRNPGGQVLFASPLTLNPELLLEGAPAGAEAEALTSETITVNQNLLWANQVPRKPKTWTIKQVFDGEATEIGTFELPARPSPESKRLTLVAVALGGTDSGNVVYVNGAGAAEKAALQIHDALGEACDVSDRAEIAELRELVQKTIHKDYALATALERGVAFHYGNMPLIVRAQIEKLFRLGVIRYLVCTSTLLEGVNLPCRNLFARGPKKGNNRPMSPADFWNLAGRAGRWGKEFQGNIVCVDTTKESLWPKVPHSRARQPIQRASDQVSAEPAALRAYIDAETPVQAGRADPVLESVFSFMATRVAQGISLEDIPGMALGDQTQPIEAEVASALESVEVPVEIIAGHPGISPLSMQRLLGYFRGKEDPVSLLLAMPESDDAVESYVAAIGRSSRYLGGEFGVGGRQWILAMLVANWMRGHSLARLISARISYYEKKGPVNVATMIRAVMDDVEQIARFEAPKYLACYLDVLKFHLDQIDKADLAAEMPDLTMMLELGVSRDTELALMGLGLSRTSAIALSAVIVADDLSREQVATWLLEHNVEGLDLPVLIKTEIADLVDSLGSAGAA